VVLVAILFYALSAAGYFKSGSRETVIQGAAVPEAP
jgi:hypothetical protein